MTPMADVDAQSEQALEPAAQGEPVEAPKRGCISQAFALAGVVLGGLYVINPGAGIIELIPDNVPIFGNLDEAAATTLLVLGLQSLFGRRKPQ